MSTEKCSITNPAISILTDMCVGSKTKFAQAKDSTQFFANSDAANNSCVSGGERPLV